MPSPQIKALETRYAGCRFRSRLEARWAVFFDELGITWEYEPEAFETSCGNYLPDFRITTPLDPEPTWFEVKPPRSAPDRRHTALAWDGEQGVVIARGMPRDTDDQFRERYLTEVTPVPGVARWVGFWGTGTKIGLIFPEKIDVPLAVGRTVKPKSPLVDHAYEAARSARFGQ